MLAVLVETLGHTVAYITDPRTAVAKAKTFRPQIVLLDIGMPYINGYELAPLLREALHPAPVSIVAVTAWGSDQDREHSRALGFAAHLLKPAAPHAVAKAIDDLSAGGQIVSRHRPAARELRRHNSR